jgi:hypothetical protein
VNRTEDRIALLPGVILEPCSDAGFSRNFIEEAARERLAARGNTSWIPRDAAEYQMAMFARPLPTSPHLTIVITSAGPQTYDGAVPATELPACSGHAPPFGA